jgi:hypothetical protein
MRHAASIQSPSLFTPELLNDTEPLDVVARETAADVLAREFVRWCWNVATDFHNSPDITNLRFWTGTRGTPLASSDEAEVLVEARRLFLKKVEQAVRKADVPKGKD